MLPVTFPLLIALSCQYRKRFDNSMIGLSCGEVVFDGVPFPVSFAAFNHKTPSLPVIPIYIYIYIVLHMGFGYATYIYSLHC